MTYQPNSSALRSSVAIPAVAFNPSVIPFRRPASETEADVIVADALADAAAHGHTVTVLAAELVPYVPPVSNFAILAGLRDAAAAIEAAQPKAPPKPAIHGLGSAIVERAALLAAVAALAKIVERKNTIPILANVRLTGTAGGLRLTATDLDIEAVYQVAGATDGALDVTVPCHTLHDLLKKAKAAEHVGIEFSASVKPGNSGLPDNAKVALEFDGLRIELTNSVLPASDFPALETKLTHAFNIPAAVLAKALSKTGPAISTEETRYYLNGVYLACHGYTRLGEPKAELRFTATDGHRLVNYAVAGGESGMPGVIVPRKTVAEVLRNVKRKGAPGIIAVELSETKVRFTIGELVITSKAIDGSFPDYERVIPRANGKSLTVDRKAFNSAIEQVAVISSDRGRAVKLDMADGAVTLTVTNPDTGSATAKIPAEYDSEPLQIGFNSSYVREMLDLIEGENAVLALADPGSPTLFSDPDDSAFTGVLMPMRV